jgi:hypothetical protein
LNVYEHVFFYFDVEIQGRVGSRLTFFSILLIVRPKDGSPVILITTYTMLTFGSSSTTARKRSKENQMYMNDIRARTWGLLLCDEVHVAPAATFRNIANIVKVRSIVHVGCTRCVTSSTDNIMKIHVRITLTVKVIRTRIFLF